MEVGVKAFGWTSSRTNLMCTILAPFEQALLYNPPTPPTSALKGHRLPSVATEPTSPWRYNTTYCLVTCGIMSMVIPQAMDY